MQLFLEAVPIILELFHKARGHLLFSNYSWNSLPKPTNCPTFRRTVTIFGPKFAAVPLFSLCPTFFY